MARKTLLTEAEMRRFMKLANMAPVGDSKTESWYPGARDEEEDAVDVEAVVDDGGVEDAVDVDVESLPEPDPMPMDAEEGGQQMVSMDDFIEILQTSLQEMFPEEEVQIDADAVEVSAEDEEGGESEDSPEADLGEPGEATAVAMADDELPGGLEESQLVNKVAARVAARLVREGRKAKMADELTERIFKRLTTK